MTVRVHWGCRRAGPYRAGVPPFVKAAGGMWKIARHAAKIKIDKPGGHL